jgi:hypothetical protein
MSENSADTSEVVKFEPKGRPRSDDTPAEEAGQAIIAKIRRAADLANENCDRAMRLAHKLAMEVRGAEDRINQLEAEVQLFRDRATRAEHWLQTFIKRSRRSLSLRDWPWPQNKSRSLKPRRCGILPHHFPLFG